MVWTEITRRQYRRDGLRYASDVTETEWRLLAPLMPPPRKVGRPREVDLRAVVNAILYIAATGCQWRALPKDCPPRSGGGTQRCAVCRRDRQPERKDHGKWRPTRL